MSISSSKGAKCSFVWELIGSAETNCTLVLEPAEKLKKVLKYVDKLSGSVSAAGRFQEMPWTGKCGIIGLKNKDGIYMGTNQFFGVEAR
jgi:hypothetical protein